MVKVKDMSTAKANYEGSASEAVRRWKQEIPKADWKEPSLASGAVELHRTKTIEALDAGRREKGIEKVSDAEWRNRTVAKGGPTMASNMKVSSSKWASNFTPYKQALEALDLPAKTADVDSNIDNRLRPVVHALVDKKKEIKG